MGHSSIQPKSLMNTLSKLTRDCREHTQSVGQTYWQHFRFSFVMSLRLLCAATTAFIHALIPSAYPSTTSRSLDELHQLMLHQIEAGTRD